MKQFLAEYYPQYEHILAATMLTLAMLGMGATLTVKDFLSVFKMPKAVAVGTLVQIVLVPLAAWLMITLIPNVPTGIAVGIALVAAMPGGSASNIFTHLGKGNAALSVVMTAICTLACLITTPIAFKLVAPIQGELQMPYSGVIKEILFYLVLPLIAGMAVQRFGTKWSATFSKWNVRGSLFIVLVIIVGSVGAGRVKFDVFGLWGIFLVILFSVVAQQVALWSTVAFRFPPPDKAAIVVEVTIRNTLLALLLYASLFTPKALAADPELEKVAQGCFFVILFYGGAAMLVVLPPLFYFKKQTLKLEAAAKAEA